MFTKQKYFEIFMNFFAKSIILRKFSRNENIYKIFAKIFAKRKFSRNKKFSQICETKIFSKKIC